MIPIRSLQHYWYCPHRYGMLYLEEEWQDNWFTVLAEIMHERVHSGGRTSIGNGRIERNVTVYSDELGIYGKTDCLEISYSKGGVGKRRQIKLIEYKPTAPKNGNVGGGDRLQLYAQYRCLSELFDCEIAAFVYYGDIRKRTPIVFDESDNKTLSEVLTGIAAAEKSGAIPIKEYGAKCNGCSLHDVCLPKVRNIPVGKLIEDEL